MFFQKSENKSEAASEKVNSKPKEAAPATEDKQPKTIHADKIHSGDKTSTKEDKKEAAAPPAKKEEKPKAVAKEAEPAKEAAPARKAETPAKEEPSSDAGELSRIQLQ